MAAVSAVVPAAGLSSRMGGPNKLLLPYKDTTVVGAVVRTLLECGLETIVVTGRDADSVAESASPAQTVFNPNFERGLGGSISTGVRAATKENAILIALADMPEIRAEVVTDLIAKLKPCAIVVPVYEDEPGRHGHPVLFDASFRDQLEQLDGDEGAKKLIKNPILVPVSGRLADIDSPSDL